MLACTATALVAITVREAATTQISRHLRTPLLGSALIVTLAHVGDIKRTREVRAVMDVRAANTALMGPRAVCRAALATSRLQTAWALVTCALLENLVQAKVAMVL